MIGLLCLTAYTYACLKNRNYDVSFSNSIPKNINDYKVIIFTSSIAACNYERDQLKQLSQIDKPIFVIGPFASNNPELLHDEKCNYCERTTRVLFFKI